MCGGERGGSKKATAQPKAQRLSPVLHEGTHRLRVLQEQCAKKKWGLRGQNKKGSSVGQQKSSKEEWSLNLKLVGSQTESSN